VLQDVPNSTGATPHGNLSSSAVTEPSCVGHTVTTDSSNATAVSSNATTDDVCMAGANPSRAHDAEAVLLGKQSDSR